MNMIVHLRSARSTIRAAATFNHQLLSSKLLQPIFAPIASLITIRSISLQERRAQKPQKPFSIDEPLQRDHRVIADLPLSQVLGPSNHSLTISHFPSLEPKRMQMYNAHDLCLPIRKDILHKAVVFEANYNRYSHACTKYRSDLAYSGRKMRKQKGSGKARVHDASAPQRRGGAKIFGPKPRSFRTDLPVKMLYWAYRMALALRFQRGEITIIDGRMDFKTPDEIQLRRFLDAHRWSRPYGKTVFVLEDRGTNFATMCKIFDTEVSAVGINQVKIKDILGGTRIVFERNALEKYIKKFFQADKEEIRSTEKGSTKVNELQTDKVQEETLAK